MKIDAAYPGGNIVVESIQDHDVHLHQDLRDTPVPWFYWCFRVREAHGKTGRFHFTQSRAIGVRGPAISLDHGRTWAWLGSESVDGQSFSWQPPKDCAEARFSFGMPYQWTDWERFLQSHRNHAHILVETLCQSEEGRAVPALRMGKLTGAPRFRVAVAARHHCCEMMVNYTLEGLIAWVLDDTSAEAAWLRQHVEFMIFPMVDLDGVERGDQGKSRHPRDHGRDYEGESLYRSTNAIRQRIPAWSQGRLHTLIDLHCPWIAGEHNEVIYLVGTQDPAIAKEQVRFSAILEEARQGPLPVRKQDFLPHGQAWNTAANYKGGCGFSRWGATLSGISLSTSIEIPYANALGVEVNQETARQFGPDLARALAVYLTAGE